MSVKKTSTHTARKVFTKDQHTLPNLQGLEARVEELEGASGSSSGTTITVDTAPVNTGIVSGNEGLAVRIDAGGPPDYTTAQADNETNGEVLGIISEWVSNTEFKYIQSGKITLSAAQWNAACDESIPTGLTKGTVYFLSETNTGQFTSTPPSLDEEIIRPLFIGGENATEAIVLPYRGSVIGDSYARGTSFVVGDLSSGVLTFQHDLDTKYPIIVVYDADGKPVVPQEIEPTSGFETTSSDITFSSAMQTEMDTDTWYVKAIGTGVAIVDNLSDSIPNGPTENGTAGTSEDRRRADARDKAMPMYICRMINDETANDQDPLGGGGSDWVMADVTENESGINAPVIGDIETNGIFNFPSTGYWSVKPYGLMTNASATEDRGQLQTWVTDDNSSYNQVGDCSVTLASGQYASCSSETIIKVSDIALDKVKFKQNVRNVNSYFLGDSGVNQTYIVFEKKCDL